MEGIYPNTKKCTELDPTEPNPENKGGLVAYDAVRDFTLGMIVRMADAEMAAPRFLPLGSLEQEDSEVGCEYHAGKAKPLASRSSYRIDRHTEGYLTDGYTWKWRAPGGPLLAMNLLWYPKYPVQAIKSISHFLSPLRDTAFYCYVKYELLLYEKSYFT